MKTTEPRYLPLYYKWMKTKRLPCGGLCLSLLWPDELELFKPENKGLLQYWTGRFPTDFNPTRQNILLFLAAMNNEL